MISAANTIENNMTDINASFCFESHVKNSVTLSDFEKIAQGVEITQRWPMADNDRMNSD